MKKFLLNISFLVLSIPVFSQIQNGSFETWTNFGVYVEPNNWTTSNSTYYLIDALSSAFGDPMNHPATVIKHSPAQAGSYCLKLQNVEGTSDGVVVDTVPGLAILGKAQFGSEED